MQDIHPQKRHCCDFDQIFPKLVKQGEICKEVVMQRNHLQKVPESPVWALFQQSELSPWLGPNGRRVQVSGGACQ